jgi:nucleoside 2-deoxyribosyltransferase
MQRKIYLIGSLRNPDIQDHTEFFRAAGHEVFDDWYAAGEKADDAWQAYEQNRGHSYLEAINSVHAVAAFNVDKTWLDWCDTAILVMPAGKSCHLELGYVIGQGKPGYILMPKEPERYDLMYRFATGVYTSRTNLLWQLEAGIGNVG